MYNLLRIHLEGVGHDEARFDPLDLDFRGGADDRPPDTALWLRNGGGKTSLLALFYSVLEPDRRHFLGGRNSQRKAIEHYVRQDDVAHVVAEWGRTVDGRLQGLGSAHQRLVTGQVMAWRRTGGRQELDRYFYAFRPNTGILDIDTLPFRRDERHRMPFQDFLSSLRRLRDEQPRLELMVTDNQRAWRQYLENAYLDPEVFRYQLMMNDDEGGAAEFLKFKDGDSFIAFLLDLVTDTARVNPVDENIGRVSKLFAERPLLETELAFTKGVAEHASALSALRQALVQGRGELEKARTGTRTLLARITASINGARQEQGNLENLTRELRETLAATESERGIWNERVLALDVIAARFRLEQAQLVLQRCQIEVAERKREVDAWALAEDRLRERALGAQVMELRAQLDTDSADSRRTYQVAALRYRLRLRRLLQETMTQAERADREALEAEGKARDADEQIRKATELLATLKARQQELQRQLKEVEERRIQLTQVGAMRPAESPAVALTRIEQSIANAEERLAEIAKELSWLDADLSKLREERSRRRAQLAAADAELRRLREKRASVAARLTALANDSEIVDIMGGVTVDVLSHASTIKAHLMDRASEANRDLVSLGVDTEEMQRTLTFINSTGYLPPSRDVERAVQLLEKHRIAASSGWQHLAENVRAEEQKRLVERAPELAAGVVVNNGDLDRAMKALEPVLIPTEPLTVAESAAWSQIAELTADRVNRRVLAPSSGYYDPSAADTEKESYSARMKESEARRGKLLGYLEHLQRLQAELARMYEESPPDGLAFLDSEIESLEREAETLTGQVDAVGSRIREFEDDQRRLGSERQFREQEKGQLKEHRIRLEVFLPQAARIPESQHTLDSATRDIGITANGLRRAESARESARMARENAQRRAAEARNNHTALLLQDQEIEVDTAEPGTEVVDDLSAPVESLKQTYQTARKSYEIQMSHSETAQLLGLVETQRASIRAVLGSKSGELLRLVEDLLDSPEGATRVARAAAAARAQEAADAALKKLGIREGEVGSADQEVKTKTEAVGSRKIDLPAGLALRNHEEAVAHLAEARQQLEAIQKRWSDSNGRMTDAAERINAARQQIEVLTQVARRIQQRVIGPEITPPEGALIQIEAIALEDAKAEVEIVAQGLDKAEQAVNASLGDLRDRARRLRSFANNDAFASLPPVIRGAYLNEDDEGLAATAAEQSEEIDRRRISLDDELKKLNSHRSGVVLELTDLVKDAIDTLEEAQGVKLPKGLGDWSGQPYLRISYDAPESNLIRGRMQAFVDDLIRAEKPRVEGMDMLIEAVRAAVGRQPFKVMVLKPNEGLPRLRAAVGEIKNWSGGQKLTTALLLYCVLTRLRIKNTSIRGRSDSQASVLLLDNPIGTANLVDLVDLQMKVARELAIQLIITTGVNDYDAIAAYPNVVRLRNRRDQRSKRGYVVMEGESRDNDWTGNDLAMESAVTAARVRRLGNLPAGNGSS